jgi:hypothetical protein
MTCIGWSVTLQVFDASSMIYAWDNYPVLQFPGLWEWMATQVEERQLVMANVAFEEVANKAPDCGEWLKDNDLELIEISNVVICKTLCASSCCLVLWVTSIDLALEKMIYLSSLRRESRERNWSQTREDKLIFLKSSITTRFLLSVV